MIGNEFDYPNPNNDSLKKEKERLWTTYTLGGVKGLSDMLSDFEKGDQNILKKSRTLVNSVLSEPNVEGEIREILMAYLLRTDYKVK